MTVCMANTCMSMASLLESTDSVVVVQKTMLEGFDQTTGCRLLSKIIPNMLEIGTAQGLSL